MTHKTLDTKNTTFHLVLTALALCALLVAPSSLATEAHEGHEGHEGHAADVTIHTVLDHYEHVRTTLVDDTVEGTAEHAAALETGLSTLHHHFDAEAAAVDPASKEKALELLGKMHVAATAMAQATRNGDLQATRDALYELSKPLVQYRNLMTGEKPVVAYCSMHKKSWLQQDEEIGNPYAGQSMPRCGSVVSGGR